MGYKFSLSFPNLSKKEDMIRGRFAMVKNIPSTVFPGTWCLEEFAPENLIYDNSFIQISLRERYTHLVGKLNIPIVNSIAGFL